MSKVTLLGAFLAILTLSIACSDDDSEPAAPATATGTATGMDRLDLVIDRLLAKDVDGLVELVEFTPRGCVGRSTVGAPPTCQTGQSEGSPVETFLTGGCEGVYLTDVDDVKRLFDHALSEGSQLFLYAVVRGAYFAHPEEGYGVAVAWGTSPSVPGLLWHVSGEGRIDSLSLGCGLPGIAEMVNLAMPSAEYVVGPLQGECRPGPGEVVDVLVDIEGFPRAGFFGPVSAAPGRPTGEIARVFVNSDTQLDGGPGGRILSILKLRMQVRVTGQRQDDCSIVAANVSTTDTPTQGD